MGYATRSWRSHLSRAIRQFPNDLLVVAGFVLVANAVLLVDGLRSAAVFGVWIRPLIAVPLLLFVPGYVLVAIAFPGTAERSEIRFRGDASAIDTVERVALSFGISVAVLPIFGLGLASTIGFSLASALELLSGIVVIGVLVAAVRRTRLPPEDRFRVPIGRGLGLLRSRSGRTGSLLDGILNVLLAVSVVGTVAVAAYVVGAPVHGSGFSTIYLTTQGPGGSPVASDYPTDFTVGEGRPLTVTVENHEGTRTAYAIVIALERVRTDGDDATVTEQRTIDRLGATVAPGETWTRRHAVVPPLAGENLRLHYYLYRGSNPPETPSSDTAYRDVYLWVDVAPA